MKWKRSIEDKILNYLSSSLVNFLSSINVKPIHLTFSSFILALLSSILYYFSRDISILFYFAGLSLLLSGLLDALDGAVARRKKMESISGAFLDSTLDKIGESAIFISLTSAEVVTPLWGTAALASSILVSYTRSRAESLGVDLKGVGLMERAERIILISIASFIEPSIKGSLNIALIILTLLSLITITHRIIYSVKRFKNIEAQSSNL
ncbi:MAG: CDP-alcohol phosphatidyltransferase family protein [Aigarchaeota archaeon]|nr:CDP-alcohol phosphatidyltransferase family protein [Aigarchaeota archaeon]MCX8193114.1 CDP-alcohol phosphatidyltransferase family protein [Nitrososphaeria archaeon]MDW7986737.1 CDP-alcohol phosphatidyltransferase family protein [Nitrososphaerota archaeon]